MDSTNQTQNIGATDSLTEYCKAVYKFQSNCPIIEKNKKGYGYKYADLAEIIKTITPYLQASGLSYSQPLIGGGDIIGVRTIIYEVESGQHMYCDVHAEISKNSGKGMTPIQAKGSIITYLRRYALCAMLGIVSDEDVDGGVKEIAPQAPVRKAAPKPATKKVEKMIYLTDAQYKQAISSDEKGIQATINAFTSETKTMSVLHRKGLNDKLKKLRDAKK